MGAETDVEWGHMETNINGITNTLVGTGHNSDGETAVYPEAMKSPEGSVVQYDHSHPTKFFKGTNYYRGRLPSTNKTSVSNRYSDEDAWNALKQRNPNSSVGIHFDGITYKNYKKSGKTWKSD